MISIVQSNPIVNTASYDDSELNRAETIQFQATKKTFLTTLPNRYLQTIQNEYNFTTDSETGPRSQSS